MAAGISEVIYNSIPERILDDFIQGGIIMRINNNLMAMNTHRQLGINSGNGAKSIEKLSSGYRINRAGDDAAGLAISEKMRAQIRGLNMASKNSQDGISLIQTAEGALNETHAILQRMRELAVQAANDTNVTVDRGQIQKEMNQLTTEVNRIAGTTEFNTMKLLNGERENVTAVSSVTTTSTKVVSGVATVADITTYIVSDPTLTAGGSAKFSSYLTGGTITIAAGNDVASALTTANFSDAATISITKSSGGNFKVNILVSSSGGTAVFSSSDTLSADANGNFVYNDHGVSFTISAENAAKISAGAVISATDFSATGTISFNDDVSKNTNAAVTPISTLSNITVSDSDTAIDNELVRTVVVSANGGLVNVYLKSGDSASATIHQDTFAVSNGTTINYDEHGIKFDYVNVSSGSSFAAAKSIATLVSSSSTTETNTVITTDNSLKFQVGSNQNQSMALEIGDMRATGLEISATAGGTATLTIGTASVTAYYVSTANVTDGTSTSNTQFALDVSTYEKAEAAVTVVNAAIESVSSERSRLGAVQNRLEHTIKNLDTSSENLQAAESRIRDVDMAKEMMEFTKNNILQQAAQAMLAQANQAPQGVLQLLR